MEVGASATSAPVCSWQIGVPPLALVGGASDKGKAPCPDTTAHFLSPKDILWVVSIQQEAYVLMDKGVWMHDRTRVFAPRIMGNCTA